MKRVCWWLLLVIHCVLFNSPPTPDSNTRVNTHITRTQNIIIFALVRACVIFRIFFRVHSDEAARTHPKTAHLHKLTANVDVECGVFNGVLATFPVLEEEANERPLPLCRGSARCKERQRNSSRLTPMLAEGLKELTNLEDVAGQKFRIIIILLDFAGRIYVVYVFSR